ncbi:MAG: hypothetical protein KF841_06525 [Phycisphaerae bacterium]|nr:hypothetical protein [Phycisphaerae bacterium]
MAKERNAFKLGVFTIIVVVVAVVVLILVSKGVSGRMSTIFVRFEPTTIMPSLAPGSFVLVGGQKVGRVDATSLVRDPGSDESKPTYFVEAKISLRADIRLRADCSAFAEGPPLGGDGIVKIDLGRSDKLFEGEFIAGAEPGGFAALLASVQSEFDSTNPASLLGQLKMQLDPEAATSLIAKLHQSLADINSMTASLANELTVSERATVLSKLHLVADNIAEMTGSLRREFDPSRPNVTLAKLHMAMDGINDGLTVIKRILASGEEPITKTLANVETMSDHFRAETDPELPSSLMAHLKQTSELINASVMDINTVTKATRDVMVLNRENLNRTLINLKESSDHIKTGLKYVLRNPWKLFNPPSLAELRQQSLFDAARSFSEAASRIDGATAQLRALAELHNGQIPLDDPDLARIQADLKESAEIYDRAEAEVWKQLGGRGG